MSVVSGCDKSSERSQAFPAKPVKIIVYTNAGGLIDTTARKFTDIAAKYTDATFVVENKPGAGGIVAMNKVLKSPADGYMLLACTKSNISKIVASGDQSYVDSLDWLAMLMADPECIITRADGKLARWEDIVADARQRDGQQIWVGPARGGLDHVMAIKTWEKSGFTAKWIPFQSGGKAKAALLGDQGVAYVGNPSDVRSSPEQLRVAVVSSPARLQQFPHTPTFREVGVTGLDDEFMWRGFAARQGMPREARQWYDSLFRQVTNDAEWRSSWEKDGIDVRYWDSTRFTSVVREDQREFSRYLGQMGIIRGQRTRSGLRFLTGRRGLVPLALAVGVLALLAALISRFSRVAFGEPFVPLAMIGVAAVLGAATWSFPESGEMGAALVPRLWISTLIPLSVVLLYPTLQRKTEATKEASSTSAVWQFVILLAVYLPAIHLVGYLLGTFPFLVVAMAMLGVRQIWTVVGATCCWLALSYFVFVRLLHVPLPVGLLWETCF